jgi:hypothetical protein
MPAKPPEGASPTPCTSHSPPGECDVFAGVSRVTAWRRRRGIGKPRLVAGNLEIPWALLMNLALRKGLEVRVPDKERIELWDGRKLILIHLEKGNRARVSAVFDTVEIPHFSGPLDDLLLRDVMELAQFLRQTLDKKVGRIKQALDRAMKDQERQTHGQKRCR